MAIEEFAKQRHHEEPTVRQGDTDSQTTARRPLTGEPLLYLRQVAQNALRRVMVGLALRRHRERARRPRDEPNTEPFLGGPR